MAHTNPQPVIPATGLTDVQKDGNACVRCGVPFDQKRNAYPGGRVIGWGLVWACPDPCTATPQEGTEQ